MKVTLKFQSTGAIPGKGEPVRMIGPSLSVGRGEENDLVLPDPDRMLSKNHCVVEDHNGNVVVVDISTNGTFLNYGKVPLGRTPTPINDGDILSLGPYELLVEIAADAPHDTAAILAAPMGEEQVSHGQAEAAPGIGDLLDGPADSGDFLDDLLGGRDELKGPTSVEREVLGDDGILPPLGEEDDPIAGPSSAPWTGASTPEHSPSSQDHFSAPGMRTGGGGIPDDWDDDLGGSSGHGTPADPFAVPHAPSPAASVGSPAFIPDDFGEDLLGGPPSAEATPETAPAPKPDPAPPAPIKPAAADEAGPAEQNTQPQSDDATQAFLAAMGADGFNLSGPDLVPTMSRLGKVLKTMIHGMREILMTRTSIKSEFRIEQTMIQAGGNNPLKFSISPEQAVEAMVRSTEKGYLDAADATEEALRDIRAHEIAMVTGMEAALKGVLKRLDPAALESKIATDSSLGNLLKSKKARYWEIYEKMYAEISDQAENDFHELFAREFAKAYKMQLEKLK